MDVADDTSVPEITDHHDIERLCCVIANVSCEKETGGKSKSGLESLEKFVAKKPTPFQAKVTPIRDFVTSHKIPEELPKPVEDDEYELDDDSSYAIVEHNESRNVGTSRKNVEQFSDEILEEKSTRKQARVQLENFSDTGVLHEDGVRKSDNYKTQSDPQRDSLISGVQISSEYPTTMMPVLTTSRDVRSFDFIPVNIIREDSKDSYTPYSERHFGDLSDVSLVPAGTSSRIQVKKGPNGKDYEYEYVYYYYDEEEDSKSDGTVSNPHDGQIRTTAPPKRGSPSSRNKYNSIERSTTVEPVSNEVIPNRNGNRGRQLAEAEDISEERLPTNTRFPPRSRSNHNTGTTEPSRARGNRPRPSLDLVDSSSFRTHQEGPEFPQNLPKGPVRFLGVTPNEDSDEKPLTRVRGRPQRIQELAPVEEVAEGPAPVLRRRPVVPDPEVEVELNRGQPSRPVVENVEEEEVGTSDAPLSSQSSTISGQISEKGNQKQSPSQDQDSESLEGSTTTEIPTTEYPSAMDKVALDLYAFLQQGQSNLVDSSNSDNYSGESTTVSEDDATTDALSTTELVTTTSAEFVTTTTTPTTTTTTEPTTTTTTTTEPTTTTSAPLPAGRGKFRRPGIGAPGTRNRFKSNGGSTTSTEASAEPTQRTRGRFGSNGNGGYKRPRPGQKPVEEDIQKDSSSSVNSEKSAPGRNRFRGTGTRNAISTTPASATISGSSQTGTSSPARPSFNKINLNRRRGRPTTTSPTTSEETRENPENGHTDAHEVTTSKPSTKPRLPGTGTRPIRPGARIGLRPRPGQATSTTTVQPEVSEAPVEEPAGEGTEEETHEAPAETSPPAKVTTVNPLNKLRNRNRLQVQPKSTTRSPISLTPRRSPLLPRRKTTEAPAPTEADHEEEPSSEVSEETEATEASLPETSTAASTRHEETRGLSGLLAPRRRIAPRRPGQIISR
ncbi:mucin-5AC, partial [Orussus abietinus]|uniref:mucin-5AC n=1 Tax=Orussus abietinus TaxID=222816 RepID=UPI0006267776